MSFDAHKNFATSLVATAPSPSTSGTTLVVSTGAGALFPAAPFNATVWPAGAAAIASNAEIVRVTNVATNTFTIARAQEGSSARAIQAGDQIAATITAKTVQDIEAAATAGGTTLALLPVAVSGPTTITQTVVNGTMLFVAITHDAGESAVTWGSMFKYAPDLAHPVASSMTTELFVGMGGYWVNTKIMGRHT